MDVFLIIVLYAFLLAFDFFPERTVRSHTVNRCYMLLMFVSISLFLITFLVPNAPKIVNIITALFPQR